MPRKSKVAPYHGQNILRWCDQKSCNIPVLKEHICPQCGKETRKVLLAPPFDVRPAFDMDVISIKNTIETLFGESTGSFLTNKLVLLNPSSFLDRQEEVILDGIVIGLYRFNISKSRFEFHPKFIGARHIWNTNTKKYRWVRVDQGAEPYIAKGMNVLAPGVLDFDEAIEVDDPVIIVSHDNQVIATGIAKESASQIRIKIKGMVVKTKDCVSKSLLSPSGTHSTSFKSWKDIATLHEDYLKRKEREAKKFIRWVINKYSLPVTVAFSGGKDSLVILNLVRKVTEKFSILYVDTGLELPETTPYIHETLQEFGLEDSLITKRIDSSIFWNTAAKLGPPGVDFRWCCKTSKLGPLNNMIKETYQQNVLSFIGQRRYESHARAKATKIWRNPWVSNQIGASPIKEWAALEIWLYIIMEQLPYNPLYNNGYSRIGCWLCPASKMAHFAVLQNTHKELWSQLNSFLENHKKNQGLPDEWIEYGLWRWKDYPTKFKQILKNNNEFITVPNKGSPFKVKFFPSVTPCVSGPIIIKGEIISSTSKNFSYLADLLKPFGSIKVNETLGILIWKNTGINFKFFDNGRFYFDFENFDSTIRKQAIFVLMTIIRGLECTGCGACLGSCPSQALNIENDKFLMNGSCTSCMLCFNVCPILAFSYPQLEERIRKEIDLLISNVEPFDNLQLYP